MLKCAHYFLKHQRVSCFQQLFAKFIFRFQPKRELTSTGVKSGEINLIVPQKTWMKSLLVHVVSCYFNVVVFFCFCRPVWNVLASYSHWGTPLIAADAAADLLLTSGDVATSDDESSRFQRQTQPSGCWVLSLIASLSSIWHHGPPSVSRMQRKNHATDHDSINVWGI